MIVSEVLQAITSHRADGEPLSLEAGILRGSAHFDDYVDASFADGEGRLQAFAWEAPLDDHVIDQP